MGLLSEERRAPLVPTAGQCALVGYLPAGYPTVEDSKKLLAALLAGGEGAGCDVVEVGIPCSEPVLDGPIIQDASAQALRAGFRVRDAFDVVSSVVAAGGRPVVMTYWNPVAQYGKVRFARDLAAAGGLGAIIPDLPPEEADDWMSVTDYFDLDHIFLVSPDISDQRLRMVARATTGFLYAAAHSGRTGARAPVGPVLELVRRTRTFTDLAIGVGFGIQCEEQAAQIATFADAVIVGSAFVARADQGGASAVREFASELAAAVHTASRSTWISSSARIPKPSRGFE